MDFDHVIYKLCQRWAWHLIWAVFNLRWHLTIALEAFKNLLSFLPEKSAGIFFSSVYYEYMFKVRFDAID